MHFILLLLLFLKGSFCDWISEWLAPVEYQYKEFSTPNISNEMPQKYSPTDINFYIEQGNHYISLDKFGKQNSFTPVQTSSNVFSPRILKMKLEKLLKNAKMLITTLKKEIINIENKERMLKDTIANGRSGVTTLIVTTLAGAPRTYFIRNGFWTLCNGILQYTATNQPYNMFTELFPTPRCIGQEIPSRRDPCVFNSIIKYQTIPTTRRSTYVEDDFLCLKETFNSTLETFLSVPKRIVDETCNGIVRSLSENILECGLRVLLEYTYYFNHEETNGIPTEYCTEKDGACKLMVGWHLSNRSIENFEFLKNDHNFKKFFIRSDQFIVPSI